VNQTNVSPQADKGKGKGHEVTVEVNGKPVVLPDNKVTGLEVKTAAKDQGVKIELDFLLTLEAEPGHPARRTRRHALLAYRAGAVRGLARRRGHTVPVRRSAAESGTSDQRCDAGAARRQAGGVQGHRARADAAASVD